jgi:TatD DNase family protein
MLVDTHCHLDAAEFDADRDALVRAAGEAGVALIVVPSVDAGGFQRVRALAVRHPSCRYALGVHPMYVDRAADEDLARLRGAVEAALEDPRFVGIGEIGLDHYVPGLDRQRQERFFVEQLRLAREFQLPVILHVRRAQDAVLKQLRRAGTRGGVAHAFNGSAQQARAYLELGFALGVGGAMTFDRALQIRRLVAALPGEAFVLETDAPDIPPSWRAGARNTPVELPAIARVVAQLRGESEAAAAAATTANALRVLPALSRVPSPSA